MSDFPSLSSSTSTSPTSLDIIRTFSAMRVADDRETPQPLRDEDAASPEGESPDVVT